MNKLTRLLNIRYPIIQGGMGNISPVPLCCAVSRAGGLGQIGVGNLPLAEVERRLKELESSLRGLPFAVNIPLSFHPQVEKVLELVKQYRVPVVSLSAGNPQPWIPALKEQGIKVGVVVGTVKQAQKAERAGADFIVGEGFEAAGKNSPKELTTMTLIPQLRQVLSAPLIAAGGIGDGYGLLAALSLGASGVQLGTRLIATREAHVHQAYQQAILQAGDEDTLVLGRKHGHVTRVLKIPYTEQVLREENQLSLIEWAERLDEERHRLGALEGQLDQGHVNAGQISGAIQHIPSVDELFESMMTEARQKCTDLQLQLNKGED